MNVKRLIGYILLSLLCVGVLAGFTCIFYFIGGFSLATSIGYTAITCGSTILLIVLADLIIRLLH